MSLRWGYLTAKQRQVWRLKSEGYTEAGIGRRLNIKRQTVHKALNIAKQKIHQSLEETAKINNIEVKTISPTQAYLTGYSPHFDTTAIVTYSPKNGIQIWYKHEGDCSKCSRAKECRETILQEARDRKLIFKGNVNRMSPSELAEALFSMITGGTSNDKEKA